ncbi:MAG: PCRF domain-containing protein [Candidatus Liptonbacteria bacterium]|nr:PCRF domain-containing protein [Candidatus Liptonbacteria bacterium]
MERELGTPVFWENRAAADEKIKTLGELKNLTDRFRAITRDLSALDKNFSEDKFFEAKRKFRALELETLFGGRYDKQSAVLSVYPGAGGEDASDWAKMLLDMYSKYAVNRGWDAKVIDDAPNHRTLEIRGAYAYGYLKGEIGVHRLVRISPFSAKKLRHTSFALVEIVPDLPRLEDEKIVIPEKDLKLEFYRSSGPGGQNVNKVETAVRVVHLPTGLTAHSQVERSQASNREKAMRILKARIYQRMEQEQVRELRELKTDVKPEWGNQIRSYVLNPYQLVKDHRTEIETPHVHRVLEGDIDIFIEGYIERPAHA